MCSYIPTSPNPTNGFTVIVHESRVVKSELDFEGGDQLHN